MTDDDPYRWLEDLDSGAATAWVRERNADTRQQALKWALILEFFRQRLA